MRVPMSWLAELVTLPADASAESVMAELVKVGLEEEGVHGTALTGPIVVGQVLSIDPEPQANGKTIRWCQVRVAPPGESAIDGGADVRGIVCGASNFEVGDKVAVTLPGAILPGGFQISARKTYGHVSDGMIASQRELGMGDDHAGILVLSRIGLDPEVGTDAISLLGLGQTAAEVNVTPDRGYCLSMRGIAREYCHATNQVFSDPVAKLPVHAVSGFSVQINDSTPIRGRTGSSRFYALAMENVDASAKTPQWMTSRLELAGMRSISIAVDISNYVMLELGQPNHTYDLDKLEGSITVRRAAAGESIETLDARMRPLHPEDLVIADATGAIGIAGVMGGARTEVSSSTKRVLIEAANFDSVSVARSARRHKLVSEASKRFERGVDSQLAPWAAARVAELLAELAGARLVAHGSGYLGADAGAPLESVAIELPKSFAAELTGVSYSVADVHNALMEIGCEIQEFEASWKVTPPSWRPDLKHKTDLVEEIARLNGYHQIPSIIPVAPPGAGLTEKQQLRRRVVSALSASGLVEVLNYPFNSAAEIELFVTDAGAIRLENPIQEEAPFLRRSLLPGLMAAVARNQSRGMPSVKLFEEGSVFEPRPLGRVELPSILNRPDESQLAALNAALPAQPRLVAVVLSGSALPNSPGSSDRESDYSDAIAALSMVGLQSGVQFELRPAALPGWHPGRCAQVFAGTVPIGVVGEIHPASAEHYHLRSRVAALELNLDAVFEAQPIEVLASELKVMPAATQDLSLVVPADLAAASVANLIEKSAGDLLESLSLIDVFQGGSIPTDKKSVTFSLTFRAADRTLTQDEVSNIREQVVARATAEFGAELRG